jgi:hypothetical protein
LAPARTGIRAAISVAQGWQLARGIRVLGISTLECLVAQAQAAGLLGAVHVVIDAQRDEFYLASYDITKRDLRPFDALHIASLAEVQKKTISGALLIGPELQPVFPRGQVLAPDAAMLGKLAGARNDFVSGERLQPIYLRETAFVKAVPPRLIRECRSETVSSLLGGSRSGRAPRNLAWIRHRVGPDVKILTVVRPTPTATDSSIPRRC